MKKNWLLAASTLLLLAPPFQESEGFLGIDWWVWILAGVLLLLLLLIIGYVLQEEPGPPIPERESKMYVTAASASKSKPEPEPKEEPAAEQQSDSAPEPEPTPEPDPTPKPEAKAEPDELTRIEGVGPKVAGLLNEAGIKTFTALAEADIDRLNQILETADYQYMNPESWPEQAALAAKGDWEAFETLTAELKGGRR